MTVSEEPTTVEMPAFWPWLFRLAGPPIGFGLGFAVGPVARTLGEYDIAPGPLRFLASLPTVWAVVATTVLGLVGGIWLAAAARRESLTVVVDGRQVRLVEDGKTVRLLGADVASARRDGSDLVVLDHRGAELARHKGSDLSWPALRAAFERHGYTWDAGRPA